VYTHSIFKYENHRPISFFKLIQKTLILNANKSSPSLLPGQPQLLLLPNRRPPTRNLILLHRLLNHPTIQISPNLHDHPGLVEANAPSVRVVKLQPFSSMSAQYRIATQKPQGRQTELTTLALGHSNQLDRRPILLAAPNHIADFEHDARRFHQGASAGKGRFLEGF
jgi:hypothetical protein